MCAGRPNVSTREPLPVSSSRAAAPPQIKVKTLTGKEIEIDIENDDTIARIKVGRCARAPSLPAAGGRSSNKRRHRVHRSAWRRRRAFRPRSSVSFLVESR
jgi:hypothetical protein